MIDIFDIWQRFNSEVNTSQNGFWRPQMDLEKNANTVNAEMFDDFCRQEEKTNRVEDYLTPFRKTQNIIAVNNGPYATITNPTDYSRFSSARILVAGQQCFPDLSVNGGNCIGPNSDKISQQEAIEEFWDNLRPFGVTKVEDSRWGAATTHLTKKPTLQKAIMRPIKGGFEIAPRNVSVIVLSYYFEPPYVPFSYTKTPGNPQTGAGDQIIYKQTPASSFLWDGALINEFIKRLKEKYFNAMRDQVGAAIQNSQKQTA